MWGSRFRQFWSMCTMSDLVTTAGLYECHREGVGGWGRTAGIRTPTPHHQPPGEALESFAQPYDVVTARYHRVWEALPPPPPFSVPPSLSALWTPSLTTWALSLLLLDQLLIPQWSVQKKSCWRRPAEVTSLPADNLLREISREEIREWERGDRERETHTHREREREGRRDGWRKT